MSQLTLYLPSDLERALRERARRGKKSLSAFVTELLASELKPAKWPESFLEARWHGEFPRLDDPPPDEDVELVRPSRQRRGGGHAR